MMTKPVVEEVKKKTIDSASIDWDELSQKVAAEINSVRRNPKHLTKQLEKSLTCFEKFKILRVKGRETREMREGAPAYIEAIEYCETQKSCKSLKISVNLTKSARDHVEDIGSKGTMTQIGSNGSNPKDRMERYTAIDTYWTESIVFGGYDAKEIVEYMLVSDNIKNRGLRTNIFNTKAQVMGVAVGPHTTEGSVTVVDFVSRELADGELPTMEIEAIDEIPEEVQKQIDELGLKGKVMFQKGGKLTQDELKRKAAREYAKQNKLEDAKVSTGSKDSKPDRVTTAPSNAKRTAVKSNTNESKSNIKKIKDDNSVISSQKSSLQKQPISKGPSAKRGSLDVQTQRTPLPTKSKLIESGVSKPGSIATNNVNTKLNKYKVDKPITESHNENEEEKYEIAENLIKPDDFEVFSDYSYDKEKDIDLPENLKSVTCTTEIINNNGERDMIIRKQYYLNDGRELRVKNIRPVKNRS